MNELAGCNRAVLAFLKWGVGFAEGTRFVAAEAERSKIAVAGCIAAEYPRRSPRMGGNDRQAMVLDNYDIKLLSLLQADAKTSQRQLSEEVNLSPSAVNRRIAALEAAGVITSTVAVVDPVSVGRPIAILVEVKLESERLDLLDEVKKRFSTCEQVQQVYYVTGDFDFMLVMNVKDMTEYEKLTRELFFSAGNIKSFKTYVAMQRIKVSLAVPLVE